MNPSDLCSQLQLLHRESHGWALCCCARNRGRAEEVLQAAYLKVLQGKAKFDGASSIKTWFFAVIRRTAADERRRDLLRLRLWTNRQPDIPGEPADAAACRSELQHTFRQALAALPRRQQQVLQLVFYHEMSLSEAAGVMELSVGSARTHYDRAKKAIRRQLEETGDGIRTRPNAAPAVVF